MINAAAAAAAKIPPKSDSISGRSESIRFTHHWLASELPREGCLNSCWMLSHEVAWEMGAMWKCESEKVIVRKKGLGQTAVVARCHYIIIIIVIYIESEQFNKYYRLICGSLVHFTLPQCLKGWIFIQFVSIDRRPNGDCEQSVVRYICQISAMRDEYEVLARPVVSFFNILPTSCLLP